MSYVQCLSYQYPPLSPVSVGHELLELLLQSRTKVVGKVVQQISISAAF